MHKNQPEAAAGGLATASILCCLVLGQACVTSSYTPPQVWKATLYPITGPYAGTPEPIVAEFVYSREGHGDAMFTYPASVTCKGEYNTMFSGGESIQLRLWRDESVASVVGTIGPNLAYGTATGTCQDGTLIECAYSANRSNGHGTGSCRDTKNGEYTLHF